MSKEIPVTASTLSAQYLKEFLVENFQLSPTTTCKLFRTGINHLYMVDTETEKFVFRVYTLNWRTRTEIEEEIRLLLHLKQNHISVSYPIADKHHSFIQEFNAPEGVRFGVLFSFAKGKKIPLFTEHASFNIGLTMAKMHKATTNFQYKRVTYSANTLLIDSFATAKSFFSSPSDEMTFVEKTSKHLASEFDKIDVKQVRFGGVHFDIWFDNMHIDEKDEITIFDFDFCGNGMLCLDIAYFMVQLYNTQPTEADYERKVAAFLKGYESITKISDEEKRIMPMLSVCIWFFYLGVQCDRFENWSNVFLNENHLKRFIGIVKKWISYKQLSVE